MGQREPKVGYITWLIPVLQQEQEEEGGGFHRHLCGWSAEQCHADRVAAISKVHNLTQKSIYIYLYSVKIESDDSFYSK